ncbi:MAG: hypothetical protein Tsb002_26880 [Wenzhouxiangellaceae bacterium]
MYTDARVRRYGRRHNSLMLALSSALLMMTMTANANHAGGQITYTDIAANPASGLDYERTPSDVNAVWESMKQQDIYTAQDVLLTPTKPRGIPGVAIFDFDNDGDEDIYVTNGPGTPNSLFENQFRQTGVVSFVDVAGEANVAAIDQDSTGVCFGDTDNDGDHDLYVLGREEPNRFFENIGGSFQEITSASGLGAGNNTGSTCSFGDVNNDGLLDVVVANLFHDTSNRIPIMMHNTDHLLQDDQLFINAGGNVFVDESASSGIHTGPGISWAIALVDYDLDGDVDLFTANDQGSRNPAKTGGIDAGVMRLHRNDGTGKFTEVTEDLAGGRFGAWMTIAFGDINSDGYMDVFGSNIGDYFAQAAIPLIDFVPDHGDWDSGWFLGNENRTFTFPGVGDELVTVPFGWGGDIVDYDNDGDLDIIYHGGWENGPFVDASNPGAILVNDGQGNFGRDAVALANSTNHSRRTVHGVAMGDLNGDGFVDVVSASNADWPQAAPLIPYFENAADIFGSPFDVDAFLMPTFTPVDPTDLFQGFTWNGIELENGSLSVELSSGNSNRHASIRLIGTAGITSKGSVNRDAIGAVVTFQPRGGKPVMKPIVSGASHASSHSLTMNLGLGSAQRGTLEIVWPGGVRNRLFDVRRGEVLAIPEIPCSYDDTSNGFRNYLHCVRDAIDELVDADVVSRGFGARLLRSAIRSYGRPSINPEGNRITFQDMSELIDFSHTTAGGEGHGGVAWLDYDNDDDLDVLLTNGMLQNNGLFRNNGDGTFTDVSEAAGIQHGLGNSGALAGDIDNDGFTDLFLTSAGGLFTPFSSPVVLYHNNGDGTFSDITANSGITDILTSWGAAFGDANGDGYLDLVVTTPNSVALQREDPNRFFLNNGDLTFTDISVETGFANNLGGCLASFTDYDLDGDQDLLFASCNEIDISIKPINLYRNDGDLQFTDVTHEAGLFDRQGAWMGFAIGDYDNDGDQDLFSTNLGNFPGLSVLPVMYENNGDGTFTDVTEEAGVSDNIFGWGATFSDFNNDGYVDLYYTGSFPFEPFFMVGPLASPGTLYINNGDKTFTNRNNWFGMDLSEQFSSGVAAADYDNDGHIDLMVARGARTVDDSLTGERIPTPPLLMRNQGNGKSWITIETVGVDSNRGGVGARVIVRNGNLTLTKEVRAGSSFLSTESPWLHFGLGDLVGNRRRINLIEVHWPSGEVDRVRNVLSNQKITIVEGRGLSATDA